MRPRETDGTEFAEFIEISKAAAAAIDEERECLIFLPIAVYGLYSY